ncbi:3-oxoacyl-ACP synthase III family protein [Marinifilum flexuosum]|uniref:3-oxoacyl-ACP synthase III family protein n=1 Tax=Marinifilum flexuosum TaxID=1117708 RepID=UPI00249436EE|nr:ketoacyl-ACP synthase III [Marinifilum flexuosum]
MDLKYKNKKISGILTVLPSKEVSFEDGIENYNFSLAKSMKLKLAMGYNKRRIVEDGVCSSDLAIHGLKHLIDSKHLDKNDIDALLFVSQSPDHFMPPTSNIIQGELELKHEMLCLDINQGCAGFIIGLQQAFMLLDQDAIKKVVLINADVLSPKVSIRDRNSNPLIGDAASITIVEKTPESNEIYSSILMNGSEAKVLQIPAGGFRMPSTQETSAMKEDSSGNYRSLDNLVMEGDKVFNFVQAEVPPIIDRVLNVSGKSKEEIDYYLFHQPNRFMLQKLADKIGVDRDKLPSNIVENFGNASGVSIPTNICYNLGESLVSNKYNVCLSGFGVGLTWGAMVMELGKLDFNMIIEF